MVEKIVGPSRLFTPIQDRISFAMVCIAALAYLLYFMNTTPQQFGMDVAGHVKYIRYVAANWSLPAPGAGWQFYHPPLYYIITGGLMRVLEWFGAVRLVQDLRWFSLACYAVFLWYGHRSLRWTLPARSTAYYMAWAMLLFWPIGMVIASRIDGNVLLYPLFAGAFYHVLRFQRFLAPRDLAVACIFTAFGVLTRSSALLMVPITLIALVPLLRSRRVSVSALLTPGMVGASLLLLFAVCFNFLRANGDGFVGNFNGLGRDLRVKNELMNYLLFPVDRYLSAPFNNVRSDATGRQYFWIGFLKSALYGEFRLGLRSVAQMLNILLFSMIMYVVLAWCLVRRPASKTVALFGFSIAVMVAASMAMRFHYPAASTQDFRYVYPLLIPFAALMGKAQLRYRAAGMKKFASAGPWIIVFFSILSLQLVLAAAL